MDGETQKTILLVEDEAAIALDKQAMLEKHGYRVRIAHTGEKAIEAVQSYPDIDLILMDINPGPGMDGADAALNILKQHDLPVIFILSHTENAILEKTMNISSYGYILKNSGEALFIASIRMAFRLFETMLREKGEDDALQESEERFRVVLENLPCNVFTHDLEGHFLYVNEKACRNTGYTREEMLGMSVADIDPASIHRSDRNRFWLSLQPGESLTIQGTHIRKNGSQYPVEMHLNSITMKGRPVILAITFDITDRIQAEEKIQRQLSEKEFLLKEVHHRIKNQVASIGGLLSLQAESVTNPEAISVLQDSISRVNSMQLLYEKLLITDDYEDISVKTYLESIIDMVSEVFRYNQQITIEKQIDEFHASTRWLFPMGVILNELLTNILKYAFINRNAGSIKITLNKSENLAILTIRDNGNGLPEGFSIDETEGFGLTLVKILTRQLNGKFTISNDNGTISTLVLDI